MLVQCEECKRKVSAPDLQDGFCPFCRRERRQYVTLSRADVGQQFLRAFGRVWPVSGFLGSIQFRDVGKRVYYIGGVLQAESDSQYQERLDEI